MDPREYGYGSGYGGEELFYYNEPGASSSQHRDQATNSNVAYEYTDSGEIGGYQRYQPAGGSIGTEYDNSYNVEPISEGSSHARSGPRVIRDLRFNQTLPGYDADLLNGKLNNLKLKRNKLDLPNALDSYQNTSDTYDTDAGANAYGAPCFLAPIATHRADLGSETSKSQRSRRLPQLRIPFEFNNDNYIEVTADAEVPQAGQVDLQHRPPPIATRLAKDTTGTLDTALASRKAKNRSVRFNLEARDCFDDSAYSDAPRNRGAATARARLPSHSSSSTEPEANMPATARAYARNTTTSAERSTERRNKPRILTYGEDIAGPVHLRYRPAPEGCYYQTIMIGAREYLRSTFILDDAASFFRAFAFLRIGNQDLQQIGRDRAVQWAEANWFDVQTYLTCNASLNEKEYQNLCQRTWLERMTKLSEVADKIALYSLHRTLNVDLAFYQQGPATWVYYGNGNKGYYTFWLSGKGHYQVLSVSSG